MKSKCTPFPNGPVDPKQMRASQQRRHLLALYLSACDYAGKLRGTLVQGVSPTGSGSRLTPLASERADAILATVDEYVALMREFVARHAPDELADYELPQPASNTLAWASNLLEEMSRLTGDMSPDRLRKYGEHQDEIFEDAERLQGDLLAQIQQARRLVQAVSPDANNTD